MKLNVRLSSQCAVLLALNNLVIVLGIGIMMYFYMAKDLDRSIDAQLMQNANAVAKMVSASDHESMALSANEDSELYRSYRRKIIDLQSENKLEFIYTLSEHDGKCFYTLDSGEGEDHSPIGMEYTDTAEAERKAFAGTTATTPIMTDQYGTHKSAFAPIRADGGAVVAIAGVDMSYDQIAARKRELLLMIGGAVGAGIAASVLFFLFIRKCIVRPITTLGEKIRNIASFEGDLSHRFEVDRHDEIGFIVECLNALFGTLQDSIRGMKVAIEETSVIAGEIEKHSDSLLRRTGEQSGMRSSLSAFIADNRKELEVIGDNSGQLRDSFVSLADTFNSIFETMRKLSERADRSKQLLCSIAQKIGAGNSSLGSLDGAMDRINENSAKMNEIISVINDISDRINLLSLNASIEAARAGDAGKGFAVVAEEISRLADATASSTRDIETLITHSSVATKEGFRTVREALSHIGSVSEEIRQINDTFEGMYSFLEAQKEAKSSAEQETEKVKRISDEGAEKIVRHQAYVEQAQEAVRSLDRSLEENGRAAVEINTVTVRIQNMMRTMREKSDFFKV